MGPLKLQFSPLGHRLAYLDIEVRTWRLRLSVAHLPDTVAPVDFYEAALLGLEEIIAGARNERRTNIVGVDANAVLGRVSIDDCGRVIWRHWVGASKRVCRQ